MLVIKVSITPKGRGIPALLMYVCARSEKVYNDGSFVLTGGKNGDILFMMIPVVRRRIAPERSVLSMITYHSFLSATFAGSVKLRSAYHETDGRRLPFFFYLEEK